MTNPAPLPLQQLLAASNLLVFAERMASSGRLSEEEEKEVRVMIVRVCKAFDIPTVAERAIERDSAA
jgi:6,7-dimethyl-8-ribityllumazine synthase